MIDFNAHAAKIVQEFDSKFGRAKEADILYISTLRSGEIYDSLLRRLSNHPSGHYRLVSVYYPEPEDIGLGDLRDDDYDAAFDAFDAAIVAIVGEGVVWVGPPTNMENWDVLFS